MLIGPISSLPNELIYKIVETLWWCGPEAGHWLKRLALADRAFACHCQQYLCEELTFMPFLNSLGEPRLGAMAPLYLTLEERRTVLEQSPHLATYVRSITIQGWDPVDDLFQRPAFMDIIRRVEIDKVEPDTHLHSQFYHFSKARGLINESFQILDPRDRRVQVRSSDKRFRLVNGTIDGSPSTPDVLLHGLHDRLDLARLHRDTGTGATEKSVEDYQGAVFAHMSSVVDRLLASISATNML
ncbi:hypothetical protein BKA70DRAFT_1424134 [Coprinopsis sp. MPI-PUGE-AT-0042]|nr:hypothetical protein BKA70DRAFT_1424134 [Coprinopsis sp. MPI-PUGE-AT-0042]